MRLRLIGHDYLYAMEQLQLMLFPEDKTEFTETAFAEDEATSTLSEGELWLTATAKITRNGQSYRGMARCKRVAATESLRRQLVRQSYYRAAVKFLQEMPAWGALSGVRPTKLVSRHLMSGGTMASAERLLKDTYYVSAERRQLCLQSAQATMEAIAQQEEGDISLYVGIPFCPTRCIYCSFVSASIEKSKHLIAPYLMALEREICAAAQGLRAHSRRIRTVYIGGGTPTTLTEKQLGWLLDILHRELDLSHCLEFTVEAGRPDTLTLEKLRVLYQHGATRISINPQTMDDRVLKIMGRSHSSGDILRAYEEALLAGHRNINMDLIAGLPGDTLEGFGDTMAQVLALQPTSITVHTLALKKAAALYYGERETIPAGDTVGAMLTLGNQALTQAGYRPYYLYRQKFMAGGFENVGWCLSGYENLYNIYMMEEIHSILSLGSGGMTKIIADGEITRLSNPKYPQEYIRDIETICDRKREIQL